jgi:ABC-type cobalt transport system, permease component CbiQ and related transporters
VALKGETRRVFGPFAALDPAARILCLALLSASSLLASGYFALGLALLALASLVRGGLALGRLLRESTIILAFAVFASGLKLLGSGLVESSRAAIEGGDYCLKLMAAFLLGRLFYATTSASQLRDGSTRIVRHIPFLRRFDVGLPLSLVLGYIPLIVAEWRASIEAARSRGMPAKPGLRLQARFLTAFLRRLMLRATAAPDALAARGWSKERGLSDSSWGLKDWAALMISAGFLVLTIATTCMIK